MNGFKEKYIKLLAWLTGLSLFVCFAVVLASSVSRYAFNSPFQWSEELGKFAMIYGTMFGASLSYLSGTQVRFVVALHLVPKRLVRVFEISSDIASLALGLVLVVSGYLFMIKRGSIMTTGLGIQMYYPQAAMLIGGLCLFIAAVIRLFFNQVERTDADQGVTP